MDPEEQQDSCRATVRESQRVRAGKTGAIQVNFTRPRQHWSELHNEVRIVKTVLYSDLIVINESPAPLTPQICPFIRTLLLTFVIFNKKAFEKKPQSSHDSLTCNICLMFMAALGVNGKVGSKQVNPAIDHWRIPSSGSSCRLLQLPLLYHSRPFWPAVLQQYTTYVNTATLKPTNSWWRRMSAVPADCRETHQMEAIEQLETITRAHRELN